VKQKERAWLKMRKVRRASYDLKGFLWGIVKERKRYGDGCRQTKRKTILTPVFSVSKLRKPQKTRRLIFQLDTNVRKHMK